MYEQIAKVIPETSMIKDTDPMAKSLVETSKSLIVNKVLSYHFSSGTRFPSQSILVPLAKTPDYFIVLFIPAPSLISSSISTSVFPLSPGGMTGSLSSVASSYL